MALFRKSRSRGRISQLGERIISIIPEVQAPVSRTEKRALQAVFSRERTLMEPLLVRIESCPNPSREELQKMYATGIIASMLQLARYQVKYHNLAYLVPGVERSFKYDAQPTEPKERLRSAPDLFVTPPPGGTQHIPLVEHDPFFVEVVYHPHPKVTTLKLNLDDFLRYWAERSFLVAVFGDKDKKAYKIADGRHLKFEPAPNQDSIDFRRCMDVTGAFPLMSRIQLFPYQDISCASFLKYLIEQSK